MKEIILKEQMIVNAVMNGLFLAITAASGSSATEEGCTDTNAYWKTHWVSSWLLLLLLEALLLRKAAQTLMLTARHTESISLEKGGTPGWISLL